MDTEYLRTGVSGLDNMLGQGLPKGHIIALLGSCGTGKTTLSLQYIYEGLKNGEKALFISLEEDKNAIIQNASSYGMDIVPFIEDKTLELVKLEPADAKATMTKINSELPNYIRSSGVKRVVLDSVSLLNMMFGDEAEKRTMLFSLCKQLKEAGATSLFTAEVKSDNPSSSRDGLVEYVADGVIVLRYIESEEKKDVALVLKIVKMRRVAHSREIKPYAITGNGLNVLAESSVF